MSAKDNRISRGAKENKKMKVAYAAQVLSHSMAGAITLMARDSKFNQSII